MIFMTIFMTIFMMISRMIFRRVFGRVFRRFKKNSYLMLCATFDVTHISRTHNDAMRAARSYKGQFNLANGDQFRTILLEI